jgi:CRISPR-associated protein Csd1
MSVLTALYKTYCSALENSMVDQTEKLQLQTVLLPIYHSNKKSAGTNDIIEVTISEKSSFIKAEWVPKDQIVIFPITENSIIRTVGIAAHPLCDELSYLSKELNPEKNKDYERVRNGWVSFSKEKAPNQFLEILDEYLKQGTIYNDCVTSLFSGMKYEIAKDYAVIINVGEKNEKTIRLDKAFITFRVEIESSAEQDLTTSASKELHQNYIDYVFSLIASQKLDKCDISGETVYCSSRHRGLMGTAKIVSISNHTETYYGRFDSGEEIVHIGYEVSQKIHLMLKFLLENNQNKRQIGESCILINWFSNDIGNEEKINLTDTISPYDDTDYEDDILKTFGESVSNSINDYITGKNRAIDPAEKFYLMIIDKISNGRISIKYFREISKAELLERVERWYQSTCWLYFNSKTQRINRETPSIYRIADAIFGLENDKGYVECKNAKLRTKTIERLLPCILENRKFPLDLKNRMFQNLCNRNSYEKTWNYLLAIGCSIFKKCQMDYQMKKEVSEMLDVNEQNRSYLYGRLLAIYEKIELDVLNSKVNDNKDRRATNAERLWSAYTKMPGRTLKVLEDKIRPYKESLIKSNYYIVINYDNLIADIMVRLRESENYEKEKNRALNEEFIFGYYAQKQDLYTSKAKKQEKDDKEYEEGGSL